MVAADKAIVFVSFLLVLQAKGDCQVKRVARAQPNAPNIIKFSIECVNPPEDDQIVAASSDVADIIKPPEQISNLPKLSSLLKKYIKDPIQQASSRAASVKQPELPLKLTLPKLQSLLKKSPEEPIVRATNNEILPKFKLPTLPELKKLISEPRSLDTAPSIEDPVKFRSQLPKFPPLIKKSVEGARDSATSNLAQVDEVLKNSKLEFPKLRSLIKKQSNDPLMSDTSGVPSVGELPKTLSKIKLSLAKKSPEDPIVSASSDLAPAGKKLKIPSLPKLQLLKPLSALKKNSNEPIVAASEPEVKGIPTLSKLSSLFKKNLEKPFEIARNVEPKIEPKLPKFQLSDVVPKMRAQAKKLSDPIVAASSRIASDQSGLPTKVLDFISKVRSHLVKPVDDLAGSATNLVMQTLPESVKANQLLPRSEDSLVSASSDVADVEESIPLNPARAEEKSADKDTESAASDVSSSEESTNEGKKLSFLEKLLKEPSRLNKESSLLRSPLLNKAKTDTRNLEAKQPSEELSNVLEKIRNTLKEALVDGKMDPLKGKKLLSKLSNDLEEGASNQPASRTVPDENTVNNEEPKIAQSKPAVGRSNDEDDFIGLTQKELDSKSCDLCKCFMKVFPQKFQDENIVGNERKERKVEIPKRKLTLLPSKISNKMRDVFRPKEDDMSVMATDEHPSIALPPDEGGEVERAEKVKEGIERLMNFVDLVGEFDEYVMHTSLSFMNRISKAFDDDIKQLL